MSCKANKKTTYNIPELLSPAGSPAALRAAIDAGADAVYFAMPEFNARINADNFTPDSFAEGVELCHISGVRAYITLNTHLYDKEREAFLKTAEAAYKAGADAAIVGDLGAASLLREYIPSFELHASTQLSGHNTNAGRELKGLGFTRMVCAREMSLEDIKSFTGASGLEAEIFVHGALCVCHSGQCLFSSLVGGRSGNRGLCAQPCRLPYKTPKGRSEYPLSLKDMCLARHIPEIIASGVSSLKIEGRMKPADYVYRVTSIYRRLLDEGRGANESEIKQLADAFSRGGSFTDSYFVGMARGELAKDMLGVRSADDKERSKGNVDTRSTSRGVLVDMDAQILRGEKMKLTLSVSERDAHRFDKVAAPCVTVYGDIPSEAINRPADEASVLASLSKFGGTGFKLDQKKLTLDEGLLIPHSALNALRRSATEELQEKILEPYEERKSFILPDTKALSDAYAGDVRPQSPEKVALFYEPEQITRTAAEYFDKIFIPLTSIEKLSKDTPLARDVCGVKLPEVIFDSETKKVETLLDKARALGIEHALVGNIGHLALARKYGFSLCADIGMNVANTNSAAEVKRLGVERLVLSPELTLPRMRDISRAHSGTGTVVYGKLPLMVTEKCLIREISSCHECKNAGGRAVLKDRTGACFTVRRGFGHRSLIFNSVPTYTADLGDKLSDIASDFHMFIFADETQRQVDAVIEAYKKGLAPSGRVRRI